jgi:hypothetical protein
LNSRADLYFNFVYASLDRALREHVSEIRVGQTADAFKARLGCDSEPLHVFVKGLGALMSPIVRYGADLLIAQKPTNAFFEIFKSGVGQRSGRHGWGHIRPERRSHVLSLTGMAPDADQARGQFLTRLNLRRQKIGDG